MSPFEYATHYTRLGFALVPIEPGSKGPRGWGWQKRGVAAHYWQVRPEMGMGLIHGLSGTVALDVDHPEWAALALAAVGIDLEALEATARFRIRGRKGAKPIYLLPEGVTLTRKPLAWPHPTERLENGRPRLVTLFELRSSSTQDVLPPSIHPDTGRAYEWLPRMPEAREELEPLPSPLLALWQDWDGAKARMKAACPWAASEPEPQRPAPLRRWEGAPQDSVIAAFNQAYRVEEILERNGYRRVGLRYVCPSSSTRLPGVSILGNRAYSHHGSDPLADEHAHDAFDVYRILEHAGDWRAAIRSAAKLLGMGHEGERWVEPVDVVAPNLAASVVSAQQRPRRINTLKAREVRRWR
jgi:putative DNA primase/helicase